MKVAGIVKTKYDKQRKLKYGDIIELTPARKLEEAVKEAVKNSSKEGETVCWAELITIDADPTFTPNGEKIHGKYSNNIYRGTGKVGIRTLDAKSDKMKRMKTYTYKIEFCDCTDSLNQPDLKVQSFEIKEMKK